jgi:signal transduction histidine kinase
VSAPTLVGRLASMQVVLAGASVAVFAVSALALSARTLERQERALLAATANRLATSLTQELAEEGDLRRAAGEVLKESAPGGIHVEIRDDRGALVLADADSLEGGPAHRDVARAHSSVGAWITVSGSAEPRRRAFAGLMAAFALAFVPLMLLLAWISRGIARRVLAPLSRLSRQVDAPAGAFGQPGDPQEVRVVADAFNRLVARLEGTLEAEQRFSQDAAHELRTPLTVVSGRLERALADPTLPSGARTSLALALEQTGTMNDVVDALLLLRQAEQAGRTGVDAREPVNLADLLREIAWSETERRPERAGDLRVEADDEVLVAGNAALLGSGIRNLLSNAFKFTNAGQRIAASVSPHDGRCRIVVEDAGPGIAPADRERVFDPFFRSGEARAQHEGVGLGLAVLRRVARAHGGDVTASASALGGARFELVLPCWSAAG